MMSERNERVHPRRARRRNRSTVMPRKRSLWGWLWHLITQVWHRAFGKTLDKIRKMFVFAMCSRRKSTRQSRCFTVNSPEGQINGRNEPDIGLGIRESDEQSSGAEHFEKRPRPARERNNRRRRNSVGKFVVVQAEVHAPQEQAGEAESPRAVTAAPSSPENGVSEPADEDLDLDDFIIEDHYFEDSWGLHSSELLGAKWPPTNNPASVTEMVASLNDVEEIIPSVAARRFVHAYYTLTMLSPEATDSPNKKRNDCDGGEDSILDRTDSNMNEFCFSNSFFDNSHMGLEIDTK